MHTQHSRKEKRNDVTNVITGGTGCRRVLKTNVSIAMLHNTRDVWFSMCILYKMNMSKIVIGEAQLISPRRWGDKLNHLTERECFLK